VVDKKPASRAVVMTLKVSFFMMNAVESGWMERMNDQKMYMKLKRPCFMLLTPTSTK
jgi:hypothetical protein